ncbi:MAG: hypothetical protein AVDCRST_MAG85-2813, partial [uncultured Solirubrobacteraceae bacterium]
APARPRPASRPARALRDHDVAVGAALPGLLHARRARRRTGRPPRRRALGGDPRRLGRRSDDRAHSRVGRRGLASGPGARHGDARRRGPGRRRGAPPDDPPVARGHRADGRPGARRRPPLPPGLRDRPRPARGARALVRGRRLLRRAGGRGGGASPDRRAAAEHRPRAVPVVSGARHPARAVDPHRVRALGRRESRRERDQPGLRRRGDRVRRLRDPLRDGRVVGCRVARHAPVLRSACARPRGASRV